MTARGPEFSITGVFGAPRDLVRLNTMTLEEHDGRTALTLYGTPLNAMEEGRATFDAGRGSMKHGFTQLTAYVAKA